MYPTFLRYSLICLFGLCWVSFIGCGKKRELKGEAFATEPPSFTFSTALSDGRRQFHIRKCAECHGPQGLGGLTGTTSAILKDFERPPSFRESQIMTMWGDVLKVGGVLRYGIPGTSLEYRHAYPFFSDEEILNMSLYALYLNKLEEPLSKESPPFSPLELTELRSQLKQERKRNPPRP